jgi:hypothetical protein
MGMLALALFLAANRDPAQTVLFIFIVWQLVLTAYLSAAYHTQKRDLDRLLDMTEQLEERYLISEIMAEPHRAGLPSDPEDGREINARKNRRDPARAERVQRIHRTVDP